MNEMKNRRNKDGVFMDMASGSAHGISSYATWAKQGAKGYLILADKEDESTPLKEFPEVFDAHVTQEGREKFTTGDANPVRHEIKNKHMSRVFFMRQKLPKLDFVTGSVSRFRLANFFGSPGTGYGGGRWMQLRKFMGDPMNEKLPKIFPGSKKRLLKEIVRVLEDDGGVLEVVESVTPQYADLERIGKILTEMGLIVKIRSSKHLDLPDFEESPNSTGKIFVLRAFKKASKLKS